MSVKVLLLGQSRTCLLRDRNAESKKNGVTCSIEGNGSFFFE